MIWPDPPPTEARNAARTSFLTELRKPPGDRADRRMWQTDAENVGFDALFDALWTATSVLYVPAATIAHANMIIRKAEEYAVTALAMGRKIQNLFHVRKTAHREQPDRSIVNARIGIVNSRIGHREQPDRHREQPDRRREQPDRPS